MHCLSFLLLALYSCTSLQLDTDYDGEARQYHNNAKESLLKLLGRERRSAALIKDYSSIRSLNDHVRRKRQLVYFPDALNTVISSTIGFTKIEVGGRELMLFVKVGTYVDATNDFYSLGPITVDNLSPRVITGVVENHAIGLRALPPTLYVLNGKKSAELSEWGSSNGEEKIIRYFNSAKEAKLALGRWGVFSSFQ